VYRDYSCYRDKVNRAAGQRTVVMVFASPSGQFYRDATTSRHLSGLSHLDNFIVTRKSCPLTGTLQKRMPTPTQTATPHTTGPLAQILQTILNWPHTVTYYVLPWYENNWSFIWEQPSRQWYLDSNVISHCFVYPEWIRPRPILLKICDKNVLVLTLSIYFQNDLLFLAYRNFAVALP
jgi:hypothetical protein